MCFSLTWRQSDRRQALDRLHMPGEESQGRVSEPLRTALPNEAPQAQEALVGRWLDAVPTPGFVGYYYFCSGFMLVKLMINNDK